MPLRHLPDSLGQRVDHRCGSAVPEAFDSVILSTIVGAVGIFRGVPKTDDDAVQRKVRADALTDGARLEKANGGKAEMKMTVLGSCANELRISSETEAGR